jgi:hypothetical protein
MFHIPFMTLYCHKATKEKFKVYLTLSVKRNLTSKCHLPTLSLSEHLSLTFAIYNFYNIFFSSSSLLVKFFTQIFDI